MKLAAWLAGWIGLPRQPARYGLAEYLALGTSPGFGATLEPRMVFLASALAAELSGCRWCIDRSRHDWRVAGLPVNLLLQLQAPAGSRLFTDRERAALAFVSAVAGSDLGPGDFERARQVLSDNELAELTALVAEHHCLETLDSNLPAS